jgi:hypothetical protein
VVQCLPSKPEVLSSNPSTAMKKKKEKKKQLQLFRPRSSKVPQV